LRPRSSRLARPCKQQLSKIFGVILGGSLMSDSPQNISFRQIEQFEQVARSQCLIFVFAHALAIAVAVLLAGVCSPA